MILSRRKFLIGAGAVIAAPAIVRVASIMPVRALPVRDPMGHYPWLVAGDVVIQGQAGNLMRYTVTHAGHFESGVGIWDGENLVHRLPLFGVGNVPEQTVAELLRKLD